MSDTVHFAIRGREAAFCRLAAVARAAWIVPHVLFANASRPSLGTDFSHEAWNPNAAIAVDIAMARTWSSFICKCRSASQCVRCRDCLWGVLFGARTNIARSTARSHSAAPPDQARELPPALSVRSRFPPWHG